MEKIKNNIKNNIEKKIKNINHFITEFKWNNLKDNLPKKEKIIESLKSIDNNNLPRYVYVIAIIWVLLMIKNKK